MILSVQTAEISKKIIKNVIGEFWTRVAKNKQHFENKTAIMRKCLTKFSQLFECGAVFRLESQGPKVRFFTGALFFARMTLARNAFHGSSDWIQKVHRCVNLVDLFKSFLTITFLQKSASIQPRTSLSTLRCDSIHFFSY